MKTKVTAMTLWYILIVLNLAWWGVAYYFIYPQGKATSSQYVPYLFIVVAVILTGISNYFHKRGNTTKELLARSEIALKKRGIKNRLPTALHGYESKCIYVWSMAEFIVVLGVFSAQFLFPLVYVHTLCAGGFILLLWLMPNKKLMEELRGKGGSLKC